jgi:RNA polymerase sigma-70 factor (ECF subfamily)
LISTQVEQDLKLIGELPLDQKKFWWCECIKTWVLKKFLKLQVSINTSLGRMRYALMNLRKIIDKHQIVLTN